MPNYHRVLFTQNPDVLKSLQRSTQAVLVGRPILPQWLTHGIPASSCVDEFQLQFPPGKTPALFSINITYSSKYEFIY